MYLRQPGSLLPAKLLTNVPHGNKGNKRVYELQLVLQDNFFLGTFSPLELRANRTVLYFYMPSIL